MIAQTVQRKRYIEKLIKLRDSQLIKVVTGVRRCGKSTLLRLYMDYLLQQGVEAERLIAVNFEDMRFEALMDYRKLYAYIMERLADGTMTYVFLDEIQQVPDFQKAVDSLFIQPNVDVYVTGSNARLLSGELATLLSGRYIELHLLPLSFSEYLELRGGAPRDTFNAYFMGGGFPYAATLDDEEIRRDYLAGIYNTVLLKDVVGRKHIGNVELLERVIRFLFDHVGSTVSPKKIADSLTSSGAKTSSITVEGYIEALMDAYILYKASRYDVRGKQHLRSLEKYYLVDMSLRHLLLGDTGRDTGHILENIVYLELKRRGYAIHIGKVDENEVDFIATGGGGEPVYYQVAASVLDSATLDRELAPFRKISDNHPKYILTLDDLPTNIDGIRLVNIIDFLRSHE
jgi:predicted AAA+ superfamily ATPase